MTPAEKMAAEKPDRAAKYPRRNRLWATTIRERRTTLGLTLRDVEKGTGICNAVLCMTEGGYNVTLETAWRLAAFFGCEIKDLFAPLTPVEEARDV